VKMSPETAYTNICSFRKYLIAPQGDMQASRYEPSLAANSIRFEVTMKWTFPQRSQLMPTWIGMAVRDYGTFALEVQQTSVQAAITATGWAVHGVSVSCATYRISQL
jgi:hypothetical protein